MLDNYLQQATSTDDIFGCIFSWRFKVKREPKELSILNSLFHRMFSTENLSVQICSLRAVAEAYTVSDYDAQHGHYSKVIMYSEQPLTMACYLKSKLCPCETYILFVGRWIVTPCKKTLKM